MKFYDNAEFKSVARSDYRVDAGINVETIAADKNLTASDYQHHNLTCDTAALQVVLPDATTLTNGWRVIIGSDSASSEAFNIATYDAATPVDIQAVLNGVTYELVLTDNGTSAGSWQIFRKVDGSGVEAEKYVKTFLVADWTSGAITIPKSEHGINGVPPQIAVYEGTGPYAFVEVGKSITGTGDVTINVTDGLSLEFDGRAVIH